MSGNDWHPSALTGELDTGVECLIAKGRAVSAWKHQLRSREVYSPTPQPDPFNALQESKPLRKRVGELGSERQIAKGAAFELQAHRDDRAARLADEPVHREPRPLLKPAARDKERARQAIGKTRAGEGVSS
jgi:hypothetical protein